MSDLPDPHGCPHCGTIAAGGGAVKNKPAETWVVIGALIAVALFLAAVAWCNMAWERWKASVYADEFQRRGMAPQAVPK